MLLLILLLILLELKEKLLSQERIAAIALTVTGAAFRVNDDDLDLFRIAPAIPKGLVQRVADIGDSFLVHGNN